MTSHTVTLDTESGPITAIRFGLPDGTIISQTEGGRTSTGRIEYGTYGYWTFEETPRFCQTPLFFPFPKPKQLTLFEETAQG